MNREEKKKLIEGYIMYNSKGTPTIDEHIDQYLDSLEMNKEKAIELIQSMYDRCGFRGVEGNQTGEAIQFAIDYMKSSQDDGEIVGWVNYYPENRRIAPHHTKEYSDYNAMPGCIQIPIRLPKK